MTRCLVLVRPPKILFSAPQTPELSQFIGSVS